MGLRTEQIVKILQLEKIGRRTAHKICDRAKDEIIDNDNDLKDFILGCIANKWVQKLPIYTNQDFEEAFKEAEKIIEKSERLNISILSIYDKDFPNLLKAIPDKPILLNFKGRYKELNNYQGVAIIGTREPTKEGIISGEYIGEYFGKKGFNVVSGLAKGCDTAAHEGCLRGKGFTTAIVAHGLHMTYPKENRELAERIVDSGGVLLSEYFISQGALSNYFVERDRLQAGLSKGTIVIQTGIKGGTMHAVRATIESKKPLAAVEYNVFISYDKIGGNEMLIKEKGAFPITKDSIPDFVEKLNSKVEPKFADEFDYKPDKTFIPQDTSIPQIKISDSTIFQEPPDDSFVELPEEVYKEPPDEVYKEIEDLDSWVLKTENNDISQSSKSTTTHKPWGSRKVNKPKNKHIPKSVGGKKRVNKKK